MQNPRTGDIKECKRDPLKNWTWEEEAVIRKCVDEYRKLGYVEAGDNPANPMSSPPPKPSQSTLSSKLTELKSAKDMGLLTQKEYEEQRALIINNFSGSAEPAAPPDRDKALIR